jgi:hypothetical protein
MEFPSILARRSVQKKRIELIVVKLLGTSALGIMFRYPEENEIMVRVDDHDGNIPLIWTHIAKSSELEAMSDKDVENWLRPSTKIVP